MLEHHHARPAWCSSFPRLPDHLLPFGKHQASGWGLCFDGVSLALLWPLVVTPKKSRLRLEELVLLPAHQSLQIWQLSSYLLGRLRLELRLFSQRSGLQCLESSPLGFRLLYGNCPSVQSWPETSRCDLCLTVGASWDLQALSAVALLHQMMPVCHFFPRKSQWRYSYQVAFGQPLVPRPGFPWWFLLLGLCSPDWYPPP
mmetsp:Transcript_45813/g.106445  ORF Transcript_45813/g.106445 Transcript_45813/m.106445 type:complete len:200 (+) Transcript_45813:332-931(+)